MSDELAWFKSSYSDTQGNDCVEVALSWRKSTYSDTQGNACVEVATAPAVVHVRDSKAVPAGPHLAFPPTSFTAFLDTMR
ncbi:DUF397 domain-containing protein [Streptomyces sp. 8K308]|uniref:DUF397 domain-containing protein n=1 Tax=Streptomyces sp. 8K308 TaxID=2530388 RepID=UPI00104CF27F|nr:DUF397 domain-containing protein [Streptomyces sp. 8K308]TDC21066.1 DUF397 domain-containing protein [Streptomyces sp. 8K308]